MFRRLLQVIGQIFDKLADVGYTSAPVWKPWRDF
jgi:hypothetical protein